MGQIELGDKVTVIGLSIDCMQEPKEEEYFEEVKKGKDYSYYFSDYAEDYDDWEYMLNKAKNAIGNEGKVIRIYNSVLTGKKVYVVRVYNSCDELKFYDCMLTK